MYKSPIEKIYGEIHTQMMQEDENMVMETIRKVGVNVDKAELIKALRYDRNQYTKGYEDGKNNVLNVVLDKIRSEFINAYPKNYLGEPELGGSSCVFSLNSILNIIDKYKEESEDEE